MVVKFRNTISPPPPQLSLHKRAALSTIQTEHGPYIAEQTQKAVYIVICLCLAPVISSVLRCWRRKDFTITVTAVLNIKQFNRSNNDIDGVEKIV
jgi:hypothetical protein